MSDSPLVSILTPCYNGAAYIDRYFETIMGQTYSNIELIFVDDGSTDGSFAMAESWRDKLEAKGIIFKLLTHPNGGQASAINVGLPEVTGKYVTWPDSDDIMDSRNIEMKVKYLEAHPEKGLVACDVAHALESEPHAITERSVFDDSASRIFDGLIHEKCGYFCWPIAYMARADALFTVIEDRRIYESCSGQNWQLLFPLTYHYDCGFIHECLVTYVARAGSHSRSYVTLEEQMRRTYELEDIIAHVLPSVGMSDADSERYSRYAQEKYLPLRFKISVKMGDKKSARQFKSKLDAAEGRNAKRELLMGVCELGLGPACYSTVRAAKSVARSGKNLLVRKA